MAAKVKLSYAHCSIFVEGMDFTCPLCGFQLHSGDSHQCTKREPEGLKKLPKEGRLQK